MQNQQPNAGADILNSYAFQFMLGGDYVKAIYHLRRALDADPSNKHALNNLASVLKQLGREPEAIPIYERLTRDHPDFMAPLNNLAFSYLRHGRYAEGWQMYQHRLRANSSIMPMPSPLTGNPMWQDTLPDLATLRDVDILVVPEQGLGDELFFLRFLWRAVELALSCRFWYAPSVKLYPLAKQMEFPATITDMSFQKAKNPLSVAIPLGSLPLLCGHDGGWFPRHLKLRLANSWWSAFTENRPALGITWRAGNPESVHRGGISKQVPPDALGAALKGAPYRIVIFQRDVQPGELDAFKRGFGSDDFEVFRHSDLRPGEELTALATRLSRLAGYVGVSNTNMHILGALGLPARVLVQFPGEWRWPATHEDTSPWFPGFTLYRQTVADGWESALEKIRTDVFATAYQQTVSDAPS